MTRKARRNTKKVKYDDVLKKDFERDLNEVEIIIKEIIDTFSKRAFDTNGLKMGEKDTTPIDFLVKLAEQFKESYGISALELAALSYCVRAVAERFSGLLSDDILAFQAAKCNLAQVLNDSSRAIRKLRSGEAKTFNDIIEIFSVSFSRPSAGKSDIIADSVYNMMIDNIKGIKSDSDSVKQASEDLIDMLARFQLITGIILKWCLVAEDEFFRQIRNEVKSIDWGKNNSEYLLPLLNRFAILGRKIVPGQSL